MKLKPQHFKYVPSNLQVKGLLREAVQRSMACRLSTLTTPTLHYIVTGNL